MGVSEDWQAFLSSIEPLRAEMSTLRTELTTVRIQMAELQGRNDAKAIESLSKQVTELERWRNRAVGAAIVVGSLFGGAAGLLATAITGG